MNMWKGNLVFGESHKSHLIESKEPVKLIQQVKIAYSFLQSVSNLFYFIIMILSLLI